MYITAVEVASPNWAASIYENFVVGSLLFILLKDCLYMIRLVFGFGYILSSRLNFGVGMSKVGSCISDSFLYWELRVIAWILRYETVQ